MPSYLHELILDMLRDHSASATDLLRELDVHVPRYDGICTGSSDINDVKPAEYRADLVLLLVRKSKNVLGVIVEVQLDRDGKKPYAWPAYIANLRARHRCPVCLLVITTTEAVARWARKPIALGPGTFCTPWVIGPANVPIITELQHARENVEFAVLSAVEHGQNSDTALAVRVASAAIMASHNLDVERRELYHDLIVTSLSEDALKALEVTMSSLRSEYRNELLRRHLAKRRAACRKEGRREGRIELILELLTARFGPLSAEIQTRVRGARDAELNTVVERMLTEQTLEQVLDPLY